ncbi:MAG: LysM peptidoglycan-binding domain-containing protein [Stellaceae bacterium]
MRRGILFGLCLLLSLGVAAFLLIPRGADRKSTPPRVVAARSPWPAVAPRTPAKPPAPLTPRFDIVTVAPDGSAVIAGRAAPGARVQVFDGGRKLGEVTADRRGEWVLVPDRPLPAGKGRLSLRAATGHGLVVASAEAVAVTVPQTARPSPPAPPILARAAPPLAGGAALAHTYVVQRGNSLWQIARHVFGAGIRYLAIYSANVGKIHNPDLIYPGQVFKLPKS